MIVLIPNRSNRDDKFIVKPLPLSLVKRYIAEQEWRRKWFHRLVRRPDVPVLDDFTHNAASWCRAVYLDVEDDHFTLTYSVKWFYNQNRRGFCRAMAAAIRVANRAGIRVHVKGAAS